MNLWFL